MGDENFDVIIIGGGPAGSCAALRLLDLGHRVALIEQEIFPRFQIGESLSPGIWNIFKYLQAEELLHRHAYLHNLPATVIWETKTAAVAGAEQRGPGVMVDRGKLDEDLISLALKCGLKLFQPAKFLSAKRSGANWQLEIGQDNAKRTLISTFILDARGRKGSKMHDKILTAPATIALFANTSTASMSGSTIIEAVSDGWLWGSPLPGKQFRMMAFLRPEDVKNKPIDVLFNNHLQKSALFRTGLKKEYAGGIKSCSVLNYCHSDPWQNNYIRLGEAAFTLDPLSSTGVEKAMRCSLQAAIAVNTVLRSGKTQIAQSFYEDRMAEAVVTHLTWTSSYYSKAWPAVESIFWKERSTLYLDPKNNRTIFYGKIEHKLNDSLKTSEYPQKADINIKATLNFLWHEKIAISPDLTFVPSTCIVGDLLEVKAAIMHPGFEREIAYIEEVEIAPLLAAITTIETFSAIIHKWNGNLSFEKAVRISIRLWDLNVLRTTI